MSSSSDPSPPAIAGDDTTLSGYVAEHSRPPAFEGEDGHPYTVSLEVEKTSDLRAPYAGYLVFPRWATSGVGIVGHIETETLVTSPTAASAEEALGELTLLETQRLLTEAIRRRAEGEQA